MVVCSSCGFSKEIGQDHTLLFHTNEEKIEIPINGSNIYHYECNPKIFKDCIQCGAGIVAHKKNKIFGCRCGYAWVEN
jgi:hypothetical protein